MYVRTDKQVNRVQALWNFRNSRVHVYFPCTNCVRQRIRGDTLETPLEFDANEVLFAIPLSYARVLLLSC